MYGSGPNSIAAWRSEHAHGNPAESAPVGSSPGKMRRAPRVKMNQYRININMMTGDVSEMLTGILVALRLAQLTNP
jgi:hypothetical protein